MLRSGLPYRQRPTFTPGISCHGRGRQRPSESYFDDPKLHLPVARRHMVKAFLTTMSRIWPGDDAYRVVPPASRSSPGRMTAFSQSVPAPISRGDQNAPTIAISRTGRMRDRIPKGMEHRECSLSRNGGIGGKLMDFDGAYVVKKAVEHVGGFTKCWRAAFAPSLSRTTSSDPPGGPAR